jgi:Core-2/I-Branching enzyme
MALLLFLFMIPYQLVPIVVIADNKGGVVNDVIVNNDDIMNNDGHIEESSSIYQANLQQQHSKRPLPINRVDELRHIVEMDFTNISSSSSAAWTDESNNASNAAYDIGQQFGKALEQRLTKLFTKATTKDCRMKIATHLSYHINAIALEESLPFTDVKFMNECNETIYDDWTKLPDGITIGDIQNRTYQPNRNESIYIPNADRMKLLYVILAHDNANATIRLIEALYEDGFMHQFVIHVDEKYPIVQSILIQYAIQRNQSDVHVVPDPYRVRVNWGGFSMVNATLQAIRYAFALDTYETTYPKQKVRRALMFHKLIHLSSSTYPIASNPEIRHVLSSYPLDANFLHIIMQPIHPNQYVWHYFVECDDAIHRIYQLPHLRHEVHNINLYTSSQWFIVSRQFAYYLAHYTEPGTMINQYIKYIEHVVVADETFFGTVLRHTKFCHQHHNQNFLHLQFDRWENSMPIEQRDPRKCPMPDPNHCGRSPTTMTLDYADIMELSADLFARKVRYPSFYWGNDFFCYQPPFFVLFLMFSLMILLIRK